jgi:hypothetical protein
MPPKRIPPPLAAVTRRLGAVLLSVRAPLAYQHAASRATVRVTCLATASTVTASIPTVAPRATRDPWEAECGHSSIATRLPQFQPTLAAALLPQSCHGSAIEVIGDPCTPAATVASFRGALAQSPSLVVGNGWSSADVLCALFQRALLEDSVAVDADGGCCVHACSGAALRYLRAVRHTVASSSAIGTNGDPSESRSAMSADVAIHHILRVLHAARPATTMDAMTSFLHEVSHSDGPR